MQRLLGSVSVCAVNFWPGFSFQQGFVNYLLTRAFGSFSLAPDEASADVVVSSIFGRTPPRFPERTICFIWENFRPSYQGYSYSISCDFDSYGGRNCRVPLWYSQLQWPDFAGEPQHGDHNFEPLVSIDSLLEPRRPRILKTSDSFCCLVARNPERHRLLGAAILGTVGQVDLFGAIGQPLSMSKYDILPRYRFNLCFENSIFPGYYTEKVLNAWVGGCVPLYYSDSWYVADFNPKALINRINYRRLEDFAAAVADVNASSSAFNELFVQPVLTTRPVLEPAIDFLRCAVDQIMRAKSKQTVFPRL